MEKEKKYREVFVPGPQGLGYDNLVKMLYELKYCLEKYNEFFHKQEGFEKGRGLETRYDHDRGGYVYRQEVEEGNGG